MQASIQKIQKLKIAENSDNLLIAEVLGWEVVVKKNEFNENDLCIYVEIDSIVPPKPEFDFLKDRHYIVRTIKLRGNLSQGLCLPLSILSKDKAYIEGDDVSEELSILHYEKPCNAQKAKGYFPSFLRKTDEVMLQSKLGLLKELIKSGVSFYKSIKEDGSSGTYYFLKGQFGMCSRNLELKIDELETSSDRWSLACKRYKINEVLSRYCLENNRNLAIQGEVFGPGIQNNKMGAMTVDFKVFDIWDIDKGQYVDLDEMLNICKQLNLNTVNIFNIENQEYTYIDEEQLHNLVKRLLSEWIEEAKTLKYGNNKLAECMVIRPVIFMKNKKHERISFKVLNNNYLLSEK